MIWIHPVNNSDYNIIGITTTSLYPTSPDISFYNDYVNNNANLISDFLQLDLTWKCVGSTPTQSASLNIGSVKNVYNVNGDFITNDTISFWSTWTINFINPVLYTFNGTSYTNNVYAGTSHDGSIWTNKELGNTNTTTSYGLGNGINASWIVTGTASTPYPLYGISETLRYVVGAISSNVTTDATRIIIDDGATIDSSVWFETPTPIAISSNVGVQVKDSGIGTIWGNNVGGGIKVRKQ